jgi:diguanylate cyclase (GGDEF)-like protein/PAS domain S-box-containing protein
MRALMELVPLGAHILEARGDTPDTLVMLAANRAASEQSGFDLQPYVGRPSAEVFPAVPELTARLHRLAVDQESLVTEVHYGDERVEGWFRIWVRPIGERRIVALYENVTEQRLGERRLRDSELLSRSIVDHLSEGVVVIDAAGVVQLVNPAVSGLCRTDASVMLGRHIGALPVAEVRDERGERLAAADSPAVRALAGEVTRGRLLQMLRQDGSLAWVEVTTTPLKGEGDEAPRGAISTYLDVTERVERERRVRHEADHDALTGLSNRRVLDRALRAVVARAGETGQQVAVMVLDLDGFKAINDRYGHAAGDRALREVASRLRDTVRDRDLVARVGGDEFVVLLPDLSGERDAAEGLRERVHEALRRPFELRDGAIRLEATIGLARYPGDATNPRGLLDVADRDMYERKRARPG